MVNSEFRKPLIQSAAILGAVLVIFSIIPSAGAAGGGIGALFSGIGSFILFLIGMAIAVPFSIAILIAIFLGVIASMSRETAAQMYSDLKKNFSSHVISLKDQWSCCSTDTNSGISEEKYHQIKEEISQLGTDNSSFQEDLKKLHKSNIALQDEIDRQKDENISLSSGLSELISQRGTYQKQFDDLNEIVGKIQDSGNEQTSLINTLSSKVDEGKKIDLENQLSDLTLLQDKSNNDIKDILNRLTAMDASAQETSPEQTAATGIFSYIDSDDDQILLTMAVEEAVSQELTYAKIDEYLTENLSPELDQIIKDHPSLTKTYIRTLKKD